MCRTSIRRLGPCLVHSRFTGNATERGKWHLPSGSWMKETKTLMQNVPIYKPLPGGYLKGLDGRDQFKIALISCKRRAPYRK